MQLVLQENGFSIQFKLLTIYVSHTGISKNERPNRGQRKSYERKSKTPRNRRHEQSIPPIMKNVRYQPNNPTETRTIPARTQIAAQHSELAINDLHRNTAAYIPVNRGSLHFPAAADNPGWMRWSPEDGEGGLRRVLLPRPLVRRKATIKSTRMTWYSSLVKPIQTI